MKDNIPVHASTITYDVDGTKYTYYVWPNKSQTKWQWSAAGNCGEEATLDKAMEAARRWMKYGS